MKGFADSNDYVEPLCPGLLDSPAGEPEVNLKEKTKSRNVG